MGKVSTKFSVSAATAVRVAALLGFLGVALGAFGAHALKATLEEAGTVETWKTAVLYHLVHSVVLVVIGLFYAARDGDGARVPLLPWGLFGDGIALFSGSLYWLALGGPSWLGPVTPIGGLCFLVGWGWLLVQPAVRASVTETSP